MLPCDTRNYSRAMSGAGIFSALSGLRVVELGSGIGAAYAAKLLVDLGARAVKVEPPGGDPVRRHEPIPADHPERGGGLFQYLNAGKRSVVFDLDDYAARSSVPDLLARADVVIENLGAGRLETLGIDASALRSRGARPALVRISPFGQTGPYRDRPATSLVVQAAGGWAARIGPPEGPPCYVGMHLEEYVAGAYAAAAALTAERRARECGELVEVDVSAMECMVGTIPYPMLQKITFDRLGFPVPQRYQPIPGILRCKDDHVGIAALTGQHWSDVCAILDAGELAEKMREVTLRGTEWRAFLAKAEPWLAARTVAEVVDLFQALRVPAVPIGNGKNLLELEHLAAREFFVAQPDSGFVRPRSPFRLSATPAVGPGISPALGEHDRAIAAELRAPAPARDGARPRIERSSWGAGRSGLPLSGIKVLDLTSFWAGPYLTMYLATLGADVIKIESPRRPDGFRFVAAFPQLGERWWEQSPVYHATNLGKRDLTLDLDSADGLALAKRLVAEADVVAENFSPRVVEHFGLGYGAVHALNPRAIMVRMPGFGLDGPCRDWVGWALTFEQAAGCAFVTGEPDGPGGDEGTMFAPGGFADPVAGMHAAVAVQAALLHRERTGEGQLVEIAQLETVAAMTAEQTIAYSIAGKSIERYGSRAPDMAPQGIYRCMGDDAWVAVSVRDDRDWLSLVSALGAPAWASDASLATLAGRRRAHDAIDARLEEWTTRLSPAQAESALGTAGVPAAALLLTDAIYGDAQLESRGYFHSLDHPVCGRLRFPGWPLRFPFGPEPVYAAAAPTLGEHNEEILGGVLGLDASELERLWNNRVIGEMLAP